MMKTIKQIADEIGVSKQAVHQKRRKEPLSTSLQPFTTTVDGVVYISVDGEKLIKQAFEGKASVKLNDKLSESNTQNDTVVDLLLKQSEMLKNELDIKNKQIEELNERLAESQKLLNQQQQLNAIAEQKIKVIEQKETEPIENEKQKKWYEFWR